LLHIWIVDVVGVECDSSVHLNHRSLAAIATQLVFSITTKKMSEFKPQVTQAFLIEKYKMQPHPEGGYYVESFRSDQEILVNNNQTRKASTAIYFLINKTSVSRMHRIKSDEIWHFYMGKSMSVIELDKASGGFKRTILGSDIMNGEVVQYTVKAGTWFGSHPNLEGDTDEDAFSFVGCTVAPGFEFADFELGSKKELLEEYPNATDMINKLTVGL